MPVLPTRPQDRPLVKVPHRVLALVLLLVPLTRLLARPPVKVPARVLALA